jgi:hypothetical protein
MQEKKAMLLIAGFWEYLYVEEVMNAPLFIQRKIVFHLSP